MESKHDEPRTYLNTPGGMHEYAHRHGAVFDQDLHKWYVVGEVPPDLENLVPKAPNKKPDQVVAPSCPLCGFHTILRKNRVGLGDFWGCSQHFKSGCRGLVDYDDHLDNLDVRGVPTAFDALRRNSPAEKNKRPAEKEEPRPIEPALRLEIEEITKLAVEVLGGLHQSEKFLTTPKIGLQGKTPVDRMKTAEGCVEVKQLILSLRP